MPRTIPVDLLTHLQGEVLTLASCWKLTTRDAQVYGYTSHTSDLVIDGVTYTSAQGMTPTSIAITVGTGIDNASVLAQFTSAALTREDIQAGVCDGATIEIFIVNYKDLTDGRLVLGRGRLGEVVMRDAEFEAEYRGLMQHLRQSVGDLVSPVCRWREFGGAECGFLVEEAVGEVTARTNDRVFVSSDLIGSGDGYYAYGVIEFTSGANIGRRMEVKKYTSATGALQLQQAMPFTVAIGDEFTIKQGCDRRWETCKTLGNHARFGGEPHVPGLDSILRRPGR